MTIDLRDINLFVAAYEERSFTVAAKRSFTTQPGISQHIRKIEERLKTQMFIRGGKAIEPTPAGDLFYQKSIEILKAHSELMEEIGKYKGEMAGVVRIGLMQTITRMALAPTLVEYVDKYPNVKMRVFEGLVGDLTKRVRSGELDFAIVPSWIPDLNEPGLEIRSFIKTPEFLVSREDQNRPSLSPVRLADLGQLSLIAPPSDSLRRKRLDDYFRRNHVEVKRFLEIDASNSWQEFVALTGWVTILPGLLVMPENDKPNIALYPIVDPPLMLELVLIKPSRSVMLPAAEKFIEMLLIKLKSINDELLKLVGRR